MDLRLSHKLLPIVGLLIISSTTFHAEAKRYTSGNHPKRSEDLPDYDTDRLLNSSSVEDEAAENRALDKISDILQDLSVLIDHIAKNRVSAQNGQSQSLSDTTSQSKSGSEGTTSKSKNSGIYTESEPQDGLSMKPTTNDDVMKELGEKLSATLSEKRSSIIDQEPSGVAQMSGVVDQYPRSRDEDDMKFKRVLTKWMERELIEH